MAGVGGPSQAREAEEGEEREGAGTQTCLPLLLILLSLWWRLYSAVRRCHATTVATPDTVMYGGVAVDNEAVVCLQRSTARQWRVMARERAWQGVPACCARRERR